MSVVRKGSKYVVGTMSFNTYTAAANYLRKIQGV